MLKIALAKAENPPYMRSRWMEATMDWQPAPDALVDLMEEDYEEVLHDVRYVRLPFYEDGYLVEARRAGHFLHAVLGGKEGVTVVPLDGAAGQLRLANRFGGLVLNRDNVGEYAKFFCGHLARSETEAFTFIEDMEGKVLDNGHRLRDMRVRVRHQDANEVFWVGGYQALQGILVRVSMLIQPGGLVQMRRDLKMGGLVTVN